MRKWTSLNGRQINRGCGAVKKLETITAYVALFSELLYLGIGLVVLGVLINFATSFKGLLDLAGRL